MNVFHKALIACFFLSTMDGVSSDSEFFEKSIRPLLFEHCQECHNPEKRKGGLDLLDYHGFSAGGDSGAVVNPGEPETSRLFKAISYEDPNLQMPPKYRLEEGDRSLLFEWIKAGAYWPKNDVRNAGETSSPGKEETVAALETHWWSRSITRPEIPQVKDPDWPLNPVDYFILDKLEETGVAPAKQASHSTLIRRLHFDLIGLPPSVEIVKSAADPGVDFFINDQVESMLHSPAFGERWARHWLDLVRYAETMGHEFDYPIPGAWRYRDYVIRAFNADLPYDRFVMEHIAGDQIPIRKDPEGRTTESLIGGSFYWFSQQVHSPVDIRQNQADLIDNQIDVLSKTFMGLTVACARCHDHKFDAITTRDFYSLYGILSSSRYHEADVRAPDIREKETRRLKVWKNRLKDRVIQVGLDKIKSLQVQSESLAHTDEKVNQEFPDWFSTLKNQLTPGVNEIKETKTNKGSEDKDGTYLDKVLWGEGYKGSLEDWYFHGQAFDQGHGSGVDFVPGDHQNPIVRFMGEWDVRSDTLSRNLQGVVRSPTFDITEPYLHVRGAGKGARLNLVIENFNLIRAPIYGGLKKVINSVEPVWWTFDLSMWQGRKAYIEWKDITVADLAGPGSDPDSWFAFDFVCLSSREIPPVQETPPSLNPTGPKEILSQALRMLEGWRSNDALTTMDLEFLKICHNSGLWRSEDKAEDEDGMFAALFKELHSIERELSQPVYVPSMVEGTPRNEPVFIRGNHRIEGEPANRGLIESLSGMKAGSDSSGRLMWAQWLTSEDHPLTARVFVNRVWHHLFGRGLVASPDDFGHMGQSPSHPELLDWLSHWFMHEADWSVKSLVKLLVESRTYQMETVAADPESAAHLDPGNLLFHKMPIKRLPGEVIRDTVLSLSSTLERSMGGPPVPVHLTRFMEGRGKPGQSGPLDGDGRRSVYLEVRRNFLHPAMLAFDTPVPSTTAGRRSVSNVPAQSLIMMNDPFILEQSKTWGERLVNRPFKDDHARMDHLFLSALGRLPTEEERNLCFAFLSGNPEKGEPVQGSVVRSARWAELCHVVLNMKEFYFVN